MYISKRIENINIVTCQYGTAGNSKDEKTNTEQNSVCNVIRFEAVNFNHFSVKTVSPLKKISQKQRRR